MPLPEGQTYHEWSSHSGDLSVVRVIYSKGVAPSIVPGKAFSSLSSAASTYFIIELKKLPFVAPSSIAAKTATIKDLLI
jgi:hypothetical protein